MLAVGAGVTQDGDGDIGDACAARVLGAARDFGRLIGRGVRPFKGPVTFAVGAILSVPVWTKSAALRVGLAAFKTPSARWGEEGALHPRHNDIGIQRQTSEGVVTLAIGARRKQAMPAPRCNRNASQRSAAAISQTVDDAPAQDRVRRAGESRGRWRWSSQA